MDRRLEQEVLQEVLVYSWDEDYSRKVTFATLFVT